MPNTNKNILLISYVFPPHYGIGGRRWAKHAKALTELGYTIFVISSPNPYSQESLWNEDIKNNNKIKIVEVASKYPFVLLKAKLSILNKLLYKFWLTVLPLLTKRNYYDRSLFWKKSMLEVANKLIQEHNINKVIATGGPFGTMYYATLLKKNNKVFLLNDLRDPWTWAPNWGFPTLSKERMQEEERLEKQTIENSDVVTVPTEGLYNTLSNKYPELINKLVIIPHVFDEDEIKNQPKSKSEYIRVVYYGSIYEGIELEFESLFAFLENNTNYQLDIYSDGITKLNRVLSKYKLKNVNCYNPLPPKILFSKFVNYDYVLMINPDYNKNNLSTKYYEIIYTRTPIILISNEGHSSDFIIKNKLGIYLNAKNLKNEINLINEKLNNLKYDINFDVSDRSLRSVTKNISRLLDSEDINA